MKTWLILQASHPSGREMGRKEAAATRFAADFQTRLMPV
jgi:hypothetical protein